MRAIARAWGSKSELLITRPLNACRRRTGMTKLFRIFSVILLTQVFWWSPLLAGPQEAVQAEEGIETHEAFDPVHHVSDGYYLDFEPFGKVELPRIFVVRRGDGSIDVDFYPSTAAAVLSTEYVIASEHEEPGLETPAEGFEVTERETAEGNPIEHATEMVAGATHLESEIRPVDGVILADLSISRHLVFAIVAALIVAIIFISLARRYQKGLGRTTAPRGIFQNMLESLIIFVRDEIAKPAIGDRYERYLPYLLTAFFFILTANLLGLVPFSATATSNLMVTAVLATFTFVITQFSASKDHWRHVAGSGMPWFVRPILIPVEILGLFTKPFALAIRLFANMTAGHLVILSLIGLIFTFTEMFGTGYGYGVSPISVGFALFIYLLELLVATIQAYIFTILSALFIGMAVEEHHHEEHVPSEEVTPHVLSSAKLGEMTPVKTEPPL